MGSFEDIFGDYFEAYKTTLQYKDDSKMEIMFRRQEFEKNLDDMWLNYSKGMVAQLANYNKQLDSIKSSPLDEISRSDNKSIVILTPDGYRDIKDELDDHVAIYIYANNKTIRSRLSNRGDKKEEADRRIKQDNKDFKDAEFLADRIFYNNKDKDIGDLVDEICKYLKTREEE